MTLFKKSTDKKINKRENKRMQHSAQRMFLLPLVGFFSVVQCERIREMSI